MDKAFAPVLPCMCASFRRASRLLTQHYEDALRPLGLRATQFTILQSLTLAGEVTQGRLGQILGMDTTTLNRTLTIMSRHGWIARRRGDDRRELKVRLSKEGQTQYERAQSHWQSAQDRLRDRIGKGLSDNLMKVTNEVTNALTE
jgi:DNA-binding MarR family transcriptional regulator